MLKIAIQPRRGFLKSMCFILIFIFMLFYIRPCTDISASPATLVSPSVLRFTTAPGSSDPSQDEWPMFRGQLNHTGEAHTPCINSAIPFSNYFTSGYITSSPAVAGGRVYVGGGDRRIYCLNATTGKQLWNYTMDWGFWSSPAVVGGRVYMGAGYKLYCLNATTGGHLWNYTTGGSIQSSPAVAEGWVYVGSFDHKVYCLNATTGKQLWNYTTVALVQSSPAVANGRVYVGSGDFNVYCLNATTGKQLWNYTTMGYVYSSPAVAGGHLYVGSMDNYVYCLNATTGKQLWNYTTGAEVWSSPAVTGERMYVGSLDHQVYCLNATTGKQLWNYTTGAEVFSSPAVSDGRVYMGSNDKNIYCLNAITGVLLWNYTTGAEVQSSPAVSDRRVYVGGSDGYIYGPAPPTYTSVTESADPLEIAGTEAITITGVMSISGIRTVLIEFEGSNHTMSDLGDNNWRYNTWTPSARGNYPYKIFIRNNLGFWNVSSGAIQVVDSTPPTYTTVVESADPLELSGTEMIAITGVADFSGIQRVFIELEGLYYDMNDIGGGTWRYNTWIPGTIGDYPYTIYLEDNAGNWNVTSGNIQVVDSTLPTYTTVVESADPLELGGTEMIWITGVADLSGIQAVLLEFEGTNHSMSTLGSGTWYYFAWKPSHIGIYSYTIYIRDNTGNWNATSSCAIQVVNSTPPTYLSVIESADPLELGGTEMIWITGVADLSGIQTVLLEFEGNNHTMSDLGGGTWCYNTWIPSTRGNYSYRVFIRDNLGFWNVSSGAIQVIDTTVPTYTAIIESANPLELGGTEMIAIASVADLSGIQSVLIEFGGSTYNMSNIGGGTWRYNKWAPSSVGPHIYWISIRDYAGNLHMKNGNIVVFDRTPPTYTSVVVSADPLELGGTEAITISGVADLSGIWLLILEFEGNNYSMNNMGDGTWCYTMWTPNHIGNYSYRIYIMDRMVNWNATSSYAIQVLNSSPPSYLSVIESANPLKLGGTEVITISGVVDLSGIQAVLLEFEGTNHSMIDLGNGTWCYFTWIPSTADNYPYKIYMKDKLGNWNEVSGSIRVAETSITPGLEPLIWLLSIMIGVIIVFSILNHRKLNKKIQKLSSPKAIPQKDLPRKV